MFRSKTVFVVGAGASHELGLPVGEILKQRIRAKVDIESHPIDGIARGDRQLAAAINVYNSRNRLTNDHELLFRKAREMARALPLAISIDNYLFAQENDPILTAIGKLAIGQTILEAERTSNIYLNNNEVRFGGEHIWHDIFCKLATEGAVKSNMENIFENVVFITFNYDRCLEHFISGWLVVYFGIPHSLAYEVTKRLEIIHVYGDVGSLEWNVQGQEQPISYGQAISTDVIISSAKGLRTFGEGPAGAHINQKIANALDRCEQVIFLGFSYIQLNVDLIATSDRTKLRSILGTTLGISRQNKPFIVDKIRRNVSFNIRHEDFDDQTCHDFLRDHYQLIAG